MKAIRHALLLAALLLALAPASAMADASAYPAEGVISMVKGQPVALPPLSTPLSIPGELEQVRVQIDGRTVFTDDFPSRSKEEVFETRHRFDRFKIALETEHALVETAFDWQGRELASASYTLVVHPLPVIPRVHVYPLVVKNQTHLVGFQLHGIEPGSQVMAWARGVIGQSGLKRIPLRLRKSRQSSRTYVVPGGLYWFYNYSPHLIFSIAPSARAAKSTIFLRGRVYTGYLFTKTDGDTVIRQTDDWKRCAWELYEEGRSPRPPRRASCDYLF